MYRCANCHQGFYGPLSFNQHRINNKCLPVEVFAKHNLKPRIQIITTALGKMKEVKTEYWELINLPSVYGPRSSPRIYKSYHRVVV